MHDRDKNSYWSAYGIKSLKITQIY
jgi:hypothetical protein